MPNGIVMTKNKIFQKAIFCLATTFQIQLKTISAAEKIIDVKILMTMI
jgi:hypothetical protein